MEFSDLTGAVVKAFTVNENRDVVGISTDRGDFVMWHDQSCCEHVALIDVVGDPQALVGETLTLAEEATSENDWTRRPERYAESWTWTFYRLSGGWEDVLLRWCGTSNGYYGESVSFGPAGQRGEWGQSLPEMPTLPLRSDDP